MVIIGAKGFAKEVLEVLTQNEFPLNNIFFFDNISNDNTDLLFNKFKIIRTEKDLKEVFLFDNTFCLGIGNPNIRYRMSNLIVSYGGALCSTISPKSSIGHYNVNLSTGLNIMTGSILTNDIVVGEGALINLNCTIGHDCIIGQYVEMSPGVHVSGNCKIGDFCSLGTNCTILPGITLGDNVIVGAGAVVTKDVESNRTVKGIPAK
jgi:sugar O-acyltransferase (sialic acid O-acetyltransferase NeuD family)